MITDFMRRACAAVLGVVMFGMTGCGGGGGGGGAPAPTAVDLTLTSISYPAVDREVFAGNDPLPPMTISAGITGNIASLSGKTVHVLVEDAEQLFATTADLTLGAGGRNNQLVIGGRARNERIGDFRGSLLVNVCLDAACSQPFQGSPIRVPYHVKVLPGLALARSEPAAVTATFPAGSSAWTSSVRLPQGATSFSAQLGPGLLTGLGMSAFDLAVSGDAVTITGKPAPVGRHDASLTIQATGTTSTGRLVPLLLSRPLDYTVTAPAQFQIVYSTAQLDLAVTSTTINPRVPGWVDTLASDGKAYVVAARIDYLAGDGVTTQDAHGIVWLQRESEQVGDRSGGGYWGGWFSLSATACNFQTNVGIKCLAPGRYDALVYPRTLAGEESPGPLRVRLTVSP